MSRRDFIAATSCVIMLRSAIWSRRADASPVGVSPTSTQLATFSAAASAALTVWPGPDVATALSNFTGQYVSFTSQAIEMTNRCLDDIADATGGEFATMPTVSKLGLLSSWKMDGFSAASSSDSASMSEAVGTLEALLTLALVSSSSYSTANRIQFS